MDDFARELQRYRQLVLDMDGDGFQDNTNTPMPSRQAGEQVGMKALARSGLYDRPERTQVADRVSEMSGSAPDPSIPQSNVQQFARDQRGMRQDRDNALLSVGDTVLVPDMTLEEAGGAALDGVIAGLSLAEGLPTGIAPASYAAKSAATLAKNPAFWTKELTGVNRAASQAAQKQQMASDALSQLSSRRDELASELARFTGPGRRKPPRPSSGDDMADMQSEVEELEQTLSAIRSQTRPSVPAVDGLTRKREFDELSSFAEGNPFVSAVPGRQGLPTKSEQIKTIGHRYMEGRRLKPAGPWGRDPVDSLRGVMSEGRDMGIQTFDPVARQRMMQESSIFDDLAQPAPRPTQPPAGPKTPTTGPNPTAPPTQSSTGGNRLQDVADSAGLESARNLPRGMPDQQRNNWTRSSQGASATPSAGFDGEVARLFGTVNPDTMARLAADPALARRQAEIMARTAIQNQTGQSIRQAPPDAVEAAMRVLEQMVRGAGQ